MGRDFRRWGQCLQPRRCLSLEPGPEVKAPTSRGAHCSPQCPGDRIPDVRVRRTRFGDPGPDRVVPLIWECLCSQKAPELGFRLGLGEDAGMGTPDLEALFAS